MMSDPLVDKIRRRIGRIPATNPAWISCRLDTVSSVISSELLQKIAEEAAEEARTALAPQTASQPTTSLGADEK